ncbi:Metal-dependent phosphohydrolase [Candidatus Magnetomorum sp. HK-1]|nr:Metal-dependent phosphohydrolase [Candidatus Magnetomorum sp. HK-1]
MAVGSHKDAFKAHKKIKKLMREHKQPILAKMASNILLDFIINLRQVGDHEIPEQLPKDDTPYNSDLLNDALQTVSNLCGKCQEAHSDGCFVNQTRRILIAAKTGVDLGSKLIGSSELEHLLKKAQDKKNAQKDNNNSSADFFSLSKNIPESYEDLKSAYEELLERDIYRSSLLDEIVNTISSVAAGNRELEMPIHEDQQLGKMANAFNIMLGILNSSMTALEKAFESIVRTLSTAIEARHPITAGHSHRVTEYSVFLGKKMGLSDDELEILKYSGLLHDIGKIAVPDAILTKKGRFNDEEREVMNQHALWTLRILDPIKLPQYLKSVPMVAACHHEKMDGTGYPYGLANDEIPFFSTILAVSDVFDALTSVREYPKYEGDKILDFNPMPKDRVFRILEKDQNTHFHPQVVKTALNVRSDLEDLWYQLHTVS